MRSFHFEYAPALVPPPAKAPGTLILYVSSGKLLMPEDAELPWTVEVLPFPQIRAVAVGRVDGQILICVEIPEVPDGWQAWMLRDYLLSSDPACFRIVGVALQIMNWLVEQNFCSQCGKALVFAPGDRALHCDFCQYRDYPRVNPCVIVAVRQPQERRILLAQSHRLKSRGIYSCLAGFVEAGESLEDALHREVLEEAGITIQNLQYVSSQPWPFPYQLMLGFVADYYSGELSLDRDELAALDWFGPGALPSLPPSQTIARQLIEKALEMNP